MSAQLEALLEATERYVPKPRRRAFWRIVFDSMDWEELEEARGLSDELDDVMEEMRSP